MTIRFKNRCIGVNRMALGVGDKLEVYADRRNLKIFPNCRFIKVSAKGFNILNLDTNSCLLNKSIYMEGMGNKQFKPNMPIRGNFLIPDYFGIRIKEKVNDL